MEPWSINYFPLLLIVSDVDFMGFVKLGTYAVNKKTLAPADDSTSAAINISNGFAFDESSQMTAYVRVKSLLLCDIT